MSGLFDMDLYEEGADKMMLASEEEEMTDNGPVDTTNDIGDVDLDATDTTDTTNDIGNVDLDATVGADNPVTAGSDAETSVDAGAENLDTDAQAVSEFMNMDIDDTMYEEAAGGNLISNLQRLANAIKEKLNEANLGDKFNVQIPKMTPEFRITAAGSDDTSATLKVKPYGTDNLGVKIINPKFMTIVQGTLAKFDDLATRFVEKLKESGPKAVFEYADGEIDEDVFEESVFTNRENIRKRIKSTLTEFKRGLDVLYKGITEDHWGKRRLREYWYYVDYVTSRTTSTTTNNSDNDVKTTETQTVERSGQYFSDAVQNLQHYLHLATSKRKVRTAFTRSEITVMEDYYDNIDTFSNDMNALFSTFHSNDVMVEDILEDIEKLLKGYKEVYDICTGNAMLRLIDADENRGKKRKKSNTKKSINDIDLDDDNDDGDDNDEAEPVEEGEDIQMNHEPEEAVSEESAIVTESDNKDEAKALLSKAKKSYNERVENAKRERDKTYKELLDITGDEALAKETADSDYNSAIEFAKAGYDAMIKGLEKFGIKLESADDDLDDESIEEDIEVSDDDKDEDDKQDEEQDTDDPVENLDNDLDSFGTDTSSVQNEYDENEVKTLNELIADENHAVGQYFEGAKNSKVPLLMRLYSDIGSEERFHVEQLMYAKSELTGEEYVPQDPRVADEYKELIAMGMDSSTAASTAMDKVALHSSESLESDKDFSDIAEELDLMEQAVFNEELLSYLMECTYQEHKENLDKYMDSFCESYAYLITEDFRDSRSVTAAENTRWTPLYIIKKTADFIMKLIRSLLSKISDFGVAFRRNRTAIINYINTNGLTGIFKDNIELYFYTNANGGQFDFNTPQSFLNILSNSVVDLAPMTGYKFKNMKKVKEPHYADLADGLSKIRNLRMTKTKLAYDENNTDALCKLFFGYNKNKQTIEGKSSNVLNTFEAVLHRANDQMEEVVNLIDAFNGKTQAANAPDFSKDASAQTNDLKRVSDDLNLILNGYKKLTSALLNDIDQIVKVNNGAMEAVRAKDNERIAKQGTRAPRVDSKNLTQQVQAKKTGLLGSIKNKIADAKANRQ